MGTVIFKYTGQEAIEIVKSYYPQCWIQKLETKKTTLLKLAERHNIAIEKAYEKFIMPVAQTEEKIVFFAALADLLKTKKMQPREKADEVLKLEEIRENVANQMVALEHSDFTNFNDKKMLRAYYSKIQNENTHKINELINSFEVVDAELIIHQPGLFDLI